MLVDILYLIGGIILLILGGNYLTDGAVAVARRFNVSSLMIGLTVVALGSAMPDIAVCVESALEHKTTIAVGDIVGANIFDLLLVVGVMALCRPWKIGGTMAKCDLPMLVLAMLSLWIVSDSVIFDGAKTNIIDRSAGLMLIIVFVFYMWITIQSSKEEMIPAAASTQTSTSTAASTQTAASTPATAPQQHTVATAHATTGAQKGHSSSRRPWLSWLMIVGGLGALALGGDWVVDGASGLALKAGMSQGMVALTVVAIGNSLPDLVTSLTATLKGEPGLALGNIVGACIIDALLAIGLSSAITPLVAGTVGFFDFITLFGASLLVWLLPYMSRKRIMGRWQGALLAALYVAYMVLIIVRG